MSAPGERAVTPPVLTVDDARDPAAEQVIADGLRRYNREQCGISDGRALKVVARDPETNAPLGGITGHTSLGVLFIDLFFLPEELRRGGVGSRLLQLAEDEGRRRGCATSFLYTISFQAPGFYERHGYRVLGTIPCNPRGTSRIFLTKSLG
jgi:GNAT superfamily N-acetyltransferase